MLVVRDRGSFVHGKAHMCDSLPRAGSCGMHLDGWASCLQPAVSMLICLFLGCIFTVTSAYRAISTFCWVGRISDSGMPAGRISEVIAPCHVDTPGGLASEAGFTCECPGPLLRKSLASQQASVQIVTASQSLSCSSSDKAAAPRGEAATHGFPINDVRNWDIPGLFSTLLAS